MTAFIILYLLFFLQFIYIPFGLSPFETPKVLLAQLGIFLLVFVMITHTGFKSFKQVPKLYSVAFGAMFLLSFVHLFFFSRETTFFGNIFRMQGVFLLWMLIAFAMTSAKVSLDKVLYPVFLFGVLAAQLVLSFIISGEGIDRAIGTIGEPNALAATVLFIWPFLYFSQKETPNWIKFGAMALVFVIIYISGSRSGMIAFLLQLLFLLFTRSNLSIAKSTIMSLVLLVLVYSLPFLPQSNLYEQRSEIWQAAVQAGLESPIIGNGFGNTEYALQRAVNASNNNLRGSYVDSSHNIFLDWWVQGGIIGLGLFFLLLVLTVKNFIKHKTPRHMVLLIGLVAALSFNPASIVSLVALWWLVGRGLAQDK